MTRTRHSAGDWLVVVAALILLAGIPASAVAAAGTTPRYQFTFGGQQPPPTHVLPYFDDFVPIYGGFKALPAESETFRRPTWTEWCDMCGIDEPRAFQAMVVLYLWAERVRFDPNRWRRR